MRGLFGALLLGLAALAAAPGCARAMDPAAAAETAEAPQKVLVLFRLPPPHFRASPDYGGSYGDLLGHSARRRLALRLARQHGLTLVDDWPMPVLGVDCFIMSVPAGRSPAEAAARLAREKAVAWAEPMNLYRVQDRNPGAASPNDPLFATQPAARVWRLADLHEIATGRNVRVAVIDSEVDADHPDLAGQVSYRENFVAGRSNGPETHGTGVAGIIAARAGNARGIVGVAPEARVMALRACWQLAGPAGTVCDSLSLARALVFAISHNAQVINLSLSGPPAPLLGRLIDAAIARGATIVGAFDPALPGGGFPASHPGVVAVADFYTAAPSRIYLAPGRDVPTTQPGGHWLLVNGNSYAAAHVSGLFALLRQQGASPRRPPVLVANRAAGGIIDACATLVRAAGPCDCACARVSEYTATARR